MIKQLTETNFKELSKYTGIAEEKLKDMYQSKLITLTSAVRYMSKCEYFERMNYLMKNDSEPDGNNKLKYIILDIAIKYNCSAESVYKYIYSK